MANLLYVGAEFDSYDGFNDALDNYCQHTKVNDKKVAFVHTSSQLIKGDFFDSAIQNRLKYKSVTGRCKLHETTGCQAVYKLAIFIKLDGNHVLRLDQFEGQHGSHVPIVPNRPAAKANSAKVSELKKICKKISNRCETLPQEQMDAYNQIFETLLDRIESSRTFKVEFVEYTRGFGE